MLDARHQRATWQEDLTVIAQLGGSIPVGHISGSTVMAIGSDIQIILHQHQSNFPQELLARLMTLADNLIQQADASPRASGHISVFLASPGGVKDERKLVLKAISRISADPYYKDLKIEAVAWDQPEDSTSMLAGIDPQRFFLLALCDLTDLRTYGNSRINDVEQRIARTGKQKIEAMDQSEIKGAKQIIE